jgi:ribosomal-protein-alanine N-acetyltransferase
MIIAPATQADLDDIVEIERHSFPRPWTRDAFAAELAREQGRLWVARDRDLVGYCVAWIVVGELGIHSIASHPDHRRAGIGRALLDHAIAAARAEGCTLATLEVRRGNLPAIWLYERAGFQTIHVRAGYYQDNHEDALVMTREIESR